MKTFINNSMMKTKHLLLTAFVVLFSYYAQAGCRVDTIYSYKFATGSSVKEKTGKTINLYDANNNQTQQLYQTWDEGSNSWMNINKYDWAYDAHNNKTQELYQTWDGGSNSWGNIYKYDWTYDANNNKTQQIYQEWEEGTNSWKNSSKYDWTYNANNNLTQRIYQTWDGGTNSWKNYVKYDYTYNANNNLTQRIYQTGYRDWETTSTCKIQDQIGRAHV